MIIHIFNNKFCRPISNYLYSLRCGIYNKNLKNNFKKVGEQTVTFEPYSQGWVLQKQRRPTQQSAPVTKEVVPSIQKNWTCSEKIPSKYEKSYKTSELEKKAFTLAIFQKFYTHFRFIYK